MSSPWLSRSMHAVGAGVRRLGEAVDALGVAIEGRCAYIERLEPSTRIVPHKGKSPSVQAEFLAPSSSVIGEVTVGKQSSIWYGAVLRGDVNRISVGNNTSIGEGAVVHVAGIKKKISTSIGNNVIISPKATVHACTIEDNCVVGAGATVMDGSVMSKGAMLVSGSLLAPGTKVGPGEVWAGVPAKKVRDVSVEEAASAAAVCKDNLDLAKVHAGECGKNYSRVLKDERYYKYLSEGVDPEVLKDPMYDGMAPRDYGDHMGFGQPGKIWNSELRRPDKPNPNREKDLADKHQEQRPQRI